MSKDIQPIERLIEVLEAYGGDPERWPSGERAELAAIVRGNREAEQIAAKARALDSVLNAARQGNAPADLHGKIMQAAKTRQSAQVIPFARSGKRPDPYANWAVASLLAASLLIGIWAGVSGIADNLVSAPLEIAGISSSTGGFAQGLGLDGSLSAAEDML